MLVRALCPLWVASLLRYSAYSQVILNYELLSSRQSQAHLRILSPREGRGETGDRLGEGGEDPVGGTTERVLIVSRVTAQSQWCISSLHAYLLLCTFSCMPTKKNFVYMHAKLNCFYTCMFAHVHACYSDCMTSPTPPKIWKPAWRGKFQWGGNLGMTFKFEFWFKGAQAWDFRRRFFCIKRTHLVPWFII